MAKKPNLLRMAEPKLPPAADLRLRQDFPVLHRHPELAYLDTAATAHKPRSVIETEAAFYRESYAPAHRSYYDLGQQATEAYEQARQRAATFFGAVADLTIFTSGATAALNLVAWLEGQHLHAGDEIVLSVAEHHSNLLPWLRLAHQHNLTLCWVPIAESRGGEAIDYVGAITQRTKLVAVSHVSNVLGGVADLSAVIAAAHRVGARVVVDAAQSAGRLPINVMDLNIDYLVASGHKVYGPTGIGVLCVGQANLLAGEPHLVGGGMVELVTTNTAHWKKGPSRFEAGTPHVAGALGLAKALEYVTTIGWDSLYEHEQRLTDYLLTGLLKQPWIKIFGPHDSTRRAGIISFQIITDYGPVHSHDVVALANDHQVAIRGGNHCAQPLMSALGVQDLTRASLGVYSTPNDVDQLLDALATAYATFGAYLPQKKATRATL